MSKMKKIVISILLSLIMLCGLNTVSNANLVLDNSRVFKDVGDVNFISTNEHHGTDKLLCAWRGIDHKGANYKAISKVTIVGKKATDYKGNVWESNWNLILGRILWEGKTEMEVIPWHLSGGTLYQKWPTVAYGVWYALPKWMQAMEKANTLVRDTNGKTTLLKSNFTNGGGTAPGKLYKIAEEYAKNYKGDGTGITDNTNYEKLNKQLIINKDSSNSKEGDTYLRIGPFNWTFAGKITDVKLYNEKEKEIAGTSVISGNAAKDIISNKDFYILMPMQNSMKKIKIKAEQEVEQKEVTIWFLEKINAQTQNLIGREIQDIPASGEAEFETDLLGTLKFKKVDKDTGEPLAGVGFKIKQKNGYYIKVNEKDEITGKATVKNISAVSKSSEATTFITDENGMVEIDDIYGGTYVVIEKKINIYGYKKEGVQAEITVVSGKNGKNASEIKIENERKTGLLEILKIDKDTKKPLSGVEFKIQRSDGKYIRIADALGNKVQNTKVNGKVKPSARGENIKYTSDASKATIFVTDEDGKVDILNILEGTYKPVEIKANNGYVTVGDVETVTVQRINAKYADKVYVPEDLEIESGKITVENERKTGLLEILKIDKDTKKPLSGVEFKIQRSDGNYIYVPNAVDNRVQNTKVGTNVKPSVRGENIQYTSDVNSATIFVTDEEGKIDILNILEGTYTPVEIKPNRGYALAEDVESVIVKKIDAKYVDSEYVPDVEIESGKIVVKNERTTGDLKIIKKDADKDDLKLSGIGFKIKTADGYLQLKNAQGEIQTQITGTYSVEDVDRDVITNAPKETATEFITDANGEIYIANILVGEYTVEETSLGENAKYYDITGDDGQPVHEVVMVKKPTEAEPWTEITLKNKRKYIDLWGYVWINRAPDDKNTPGINDGDNSLYNGTTQDIHDQLFSGIEVRLKDRTTNEIVSTMVTGKVTNSVLNVEEGHYYFEKVSIDKLQDYYIEFEYDGLTYESSPARVDRANGSKAIEGENRTAFNNKFSVVEGPQSGEASNIGHTNELTLNYNIEGATGNERAKATLEHDNNFIIQSDTDKVYDGGIDKMQVIGDNGQFYTADYIRKNAVTEVPDINLGLFERSQPDLRIAKDIKNVKLTINHKSHVYNYSQVIRDDGTEDPGNNVGVVFGTKSNPKSYYRAIYEADLNYEDPNDKNNELEAYVTYQIKIYNDSNVIVRVNSIADYADERYHLEKIGTKYNKDTGDIENNVNSTDSGNIGNYHKYVIETNAVVGANENANIYVQFKLNRNDLKGIFGENDSSQKDLENVVEINSYSPLKDGAPYAGIDIDSNPGNCVPLEYNGENEGLVLYEDDTDISQPLKLVINGPRKISGTVFIDNADEGKLQELQIREGNGQLDNGEIGVKGVTVTLNEKSGSSKSYTQTTDDNGNFTIEGYIPGDYELTYTWGGQTYTLDGKQKTISVQDYKGTIYDKERYTDNYENGNTKWYKGTDKNNPEIRYTDAVDDWNRRQDIDKEINPFNGKTNSKITINTMDSTTPEMDIGVELDDFNDEQNGVSYANEIDNVDFGIIERAKQEVSMSKRIESIKVTLANGQVLADLTIGEDGTITGERKNVTYERPTGIGPWNTKHGFAKLELDNELLQGTVVEVGYIITATNNSEKDYTNEEYYYYGNGHQDVNKLVEITNLDVIDYLDRDWGYESDKNLDWDIKEKEDLNGRVIPEVLGTENSEEDEQVTKINEKLILEQKLGDINLKPGEKKSVELKVSKLVTTSSEINLDNETEVIEIDKTGGSRPTSIPGNYIPGTGHTEPDDAVAERTIVAPSTGGDQNYIIPILIGTTLLVILGTGVIFIKKKIIKSDD